MGQGTVAFDKGLLLKSLTVIEVADHGPFSPFSRAMHFLVVAPQCQSVDRPGIINMLGQSKANGAGQGIERLP